MSEDLDLADLLELCDSWVVSLRAAGRSRETIKVYVRNVGQYLTLCEAARLSPLNRRSLDAFIADLLDRGREGATARRRLTAIKQ